jgi:hypothetical protein
VGHLSPDTLVDLLDGTLDAGSVPHLATCPSCRQQLDELRAASAAVDRHIPEPSPAFWDHLSARISERIASEPPARRAWWAFDWSWRGATVALATAAVVVLAVAVSLERPTVVAPAGTDAIERPAVVESAMTAAADDEPIAFVADLASELDWDSVAEAGLAPRGSVDVAVTDLTDGERVELQRLLTEALGKS